MPHITIAAASVVTPMGVNKAGQQQIDATVTNRKLTDWIVRPGYESTVVADDEIIAAGAASVTVRARVQLAATWNSTFGVLRVMLMRNDTEIRTADFVNGTNALTLPDTAATLAVGDRLWLRMTNTTSGGFSMTGTVQGGTNTYLTADFA
ncbi:hypothetical protein BOX37_31155 [Nocardia mangyaensis]|uniref:Uncharacterized protein n=1 Tax=Nocardia mangyaensis TaxID=2213200 RepID=A0A1J0W071_9NOCA|nr:hypothetical protein [Nocardia mangyaensis]APE37654.1 hypothetical protein BOX37_31155 [Nocardia mangyaensis]